MHKLFTFLMLSLFVLSVQAQSWTSYLKQSKVNDFFEEEDQVWVATDAGVFIIDKEDHAVEHWTKFNAGLPSNQVEKIGKHPETGQMFIGTYDVGLAMKTSNGWTSLPYPEEMMENQAMLTYCFEWDGDGQLWAGTDRGLLRYDDNSGWMHIAQEGATQFMFQVWEMEKDQEGDLLVAGNVLVKVSGDSMTQLSPVDFTGIESLFAYSSAHLAVQENGVIWYFTDVGTVGRFEGDSLEVFSSLTGEETVAFNLIEFLVEDDAGVLWAYIDGWGFYKYDDNAWEPASFGENIDENNLLGMYYMDGEPLFVYSGEAQIGTTSDERFTMVEYPFEGPLFNYQYDFEGNLWMKEGNFNLKQVDDEEDHPILAEGEAFHFSDYTIAPDGTIWVTSGSNVYHQTDEGWEIFNHTNTVLPDAYGYRHIVAGSNGHIWVQIYDKGIYFYNGQEWKHYFLPIPVESYVASMVSGADGSIWLTFWDNYTGNKVAQLSQNDYKIYTEADIGLGEVYLRELFYESENEKLWLITGEGQFFTLEDNNWELQSMALDMEDFGFVSGFMIKNGLLVVNSNTQMGLYQNGEWTLYEPDNSPLAEDAIADIGLDASGQLWISHYGNRGAIEIYQSGVVMTADSEIVSQELSFSLSPNPAVDIIKVQMDQAGQANRAFARIYQMDGTLIKVYEIDAYSLKEGIQLPIGHLAAGVYYLEIDAGKRIGQRFLKL